MGFILGLTLGALAGFYFQKVWKKFNDWLDEGGPHDPDLVRV